MKKSLNLFLIIFVCIVFISGCSKKIKKDDKPSIPDVKFTNNFNIDLIKTTRRDSNYLISPYSIEIALNMLKEGANNNTRKQIEKILTNRKISDVSIKNRVNIANAIFIKDSYKDKVKSSYKNLLSNNYKSEILYDKFKTPKVINDWVNDKTDGMIKRIIDNIDPDFAIGLANAIAIDVEWQSSFDCSKTNKETFTKLNGKKIDVEMMHQSYESSDYEYLKNDKAVGIIMPYAPYNKKTGEVDYENGSKLEFIGILPNEDINNYINNMSDKDLDNLIKTGKKASNNLEINLSLPRFKYSYEVPNFNEVLMSMGIKDAFESDKADFTNIMDKTDMKDNLYVSDAIHKTYIDLNEKGTKAAAVTYFGMKDSFAILEEEKETINIKFNKPFIYMIRDKNSKEILFFGAVFEPNLWEGTTCK